jgi:chromosome segregation and condensation protein ScpB
MKITKKRLMENAGIKRPIKEGATLANGGEPLTVKQMADLFAKISAELKGFSEQDVECSLELGEIGGYGEGSMPIDKIKYSVDEEDGISSVTFMVQYA